MGVPQTSANEGCISAEELFRQHAPFVARFLFRLGVRPDGIEDALQEVFLVVHRQGGYLPGTAKPTSYLANLAVHAAAAHRRRERARVAREADAVVEDVASTRSDPVEVLETNESLRRLQDALDRLEPDLRTTLVLVELEGQTCASIAAAMGIPVGTVYWRLHRARKKFQRALQTEAATRPHRAFAVQAAGPAGGLRPERKERAGMMVLLMTSRSWTSSEAHDLLRLGATRPPVDYAVHLGLARHQQLAASGAPAPSWASGVATAAKGAAWITAATATAAVAAAVMLLAKQGAAPSSPAAQTAVAPQTRSTAALRSASSWRPSRTPESSTVGPSVPVEALPLATALPASAVVTRSAPSVDTARDPRLVAPTGPDLFERLEPSAPVGGDPPRASSAPPTDDLLELQQVARAERLLETDPDRALALVRAAEARFPNGYVKEERSYVEVMALVALDRLDEARPKIVRFLHDYPESAFRGRVHDAWRRLHLEP